MTNLDYMDVLSLKNISKDIISDFDALRQRLHSLEAITGLLDNVHYAICKNNYEIKNIEGECCNEMESIMGKLDMFLEKLEEEICIPPHCDL